MQHHEDDTASAATDVPFAPSAGTPIPLDTGDASSPINSEIISLESVDEDSFQAADANGRRLCPPPDPLLHWVFLGIALTIVVLAAVLRVRGEHQVVLPWIEQPLPEVCTLKRYLGVSCPGCGLTRSFISLADGDLFRAWRFNPVGPAIALLVCFQLPYRIVQLWRLYRGLPEIQLRRLGGWGLLILATALFTQWLVGLIAGSA
jgi:hypothetical protein